MVTSNPFYRQTDNTRSAWGHTFELTPDHPSPEQYECLRQTYDVLAEKALDRLNEISPPTDKRLPRNNEHQRDTADSDNTTPPPARRDLYALLKEHKQNDKVLQEFWTQLTTVPDWVDWDQLSRGQDVFYRYGGAIFTGLAYMSLLGGFGAAKIVETLARTGGFSTKVARNRLFETTQYLLQVTQSLDSIRPDGDGFKSTVRVRLLHTSVRHRILKLAETRPEYYDTKEFGVPINDLDSIGTVASFSSTLIWLALPRQGIFMRKQEIEDYIALWRYLGYLIGAPTDGFFDTPDNAKRMLDMILLNEIKPSDTSRILANNMIKALANQAPNYASADFLIASARWMNGNALCDELGLSRPSSYYWALMAGQCAFFCVMMYTYRSVASLDRQKIATMKRLFYKIIVESKHGLKGQPSTFDFRYIPQYSTITAMGESEEKALKDRSVEARNLRALLTMLASLGVMILISAKGAHLLWRAVV